MSPYNIVAETSKERKYIEDTVERLDLKNRLFIMGAAEPNTCPLEARYQIKKGPTREGVCDGGTLEMYVDDAAPCVHVGNFPDAIKFFIISCDQPLLTSFALDDVLIEIYRKVP